MHGSYCQMYSYAGLFGFDLSSIFQTVLLKIGPKHEFPKDLVQTSPKYQCQSRFVTIQHARSILQGLYCQMYSYAETSGLGLSWLLAIVPFNIGPKYEF